MKTNLMALSAFACAAFVGASLFAEPLDLGSKRELFVDDYLIDQLDGARLALGRPKDEGVVFRYDKPWEGQYSGYGVFLKLADDDYRYYYRGGPRFAPWSKKLGNPSCLALSKDGIHWERPNLGLHEVLGSKDNNIILMEGAFSHNFAPFLDKPGTPKSERLKAVGGTKESGVAVFSSEDGIHWKKMFGGKSSFRDFALDSMNLAFWSEAEQRYVFYGRTWIGGPGGPWRWIMRATSEDLEHWNRPENVRILHDGKDVPLNNYYHNGTKPYFRAPHIYISLCSMFHEAFRKNWKEQPAPLKIDEYLSRVFTEGRVLTEDQIATLKIEHAERANACSSGGLMSSRGGNTFQRTFMEDFIRPPIGSENWIARCNYPCVGVVQTGPAEMSIYADIHSGQPTRGVRRYSLRLDGFASLRAPFTGGQMVTKPFTFDGSKLSINYATSARGKIRMQFETSDGDPIEGFAFHNCREIVGNEIERYVIFDNSTDLGALSGKPVRLRFVMKDADLYSFQFEK